MNTHEPFAGRPEHVDAVKEQLAALFAIEHLGAVGSLGRFAIRYDLEPEGLERPFEVRKGLWPRRQYRDYDAIAPAGLDTADIAAVTRVHGRPFSVDPGHQAVFLFQFLGPLGFHDIRDTDPLSHGLEFLPPDARTLHVRQVGDVKIRTLSAGVQALFDGSGGTARKYRQPIGDYARFRARLRHRPDMAHELDSNETLQAFRSLHWRD